MFQGTQLSRLQIASAVMGSLLLFCDQNGSAPLSNERDSTEPARLAAGVVATVNGTPIYEEDIDHWLKRHGAGARSRLSHGQIRNVLEPIIKQELIYQKSVKLGLDRDPSYREKLRQKEAELNAFKRQALSQVFSARQIADRAKVSEKELRDYFAEHASEIRTEFHVYQILKRTEGEIRQVRRSLQQPTSFEDVAASQFPGLPESAAKPWDLGYLKWQQLPEPWRGFLRNMKKGEVSGIIRGPQRRFWILKLIDKREDREVSFESVRPTLMTALSAARAEELREQTDRELRNKGRIVYSQSWSPQKGAQAE